MAGRLVVNSSFYVRDQGSPVGTARSDIQEVVNSQIDLNHQATLAEVARKFADRFGAAGRVTLTINNEPIGRQGAEYADRETEGLAILEEVARQLEHAFSKGKTSTAGCASALAVAGYLVDDQFHGASRKVAGALLKTENVGVGSATDKGASDAPESVTVGVLPNGEEESASGTLPVSAINISLQSGGARIHERTRLDNGVEAEQIISFALKRVDGSLSKALQTLGLKSLDENHATTVSVEYVGYTSTKPDIKEILVRRAQGAWNGLMNLFREYFKDKAGTIFFENMPSESAWVELSRPKLPEIDRNDQENSPKKTVVSAVKFNRDLINGKLDFSRTEQGFFAPAGILSIVKDYREALAESALLNFHRSTIGALRRDESVDIIDVAMTERSRKLPDAVMASELANVKSTDELWSELRKDLVRHLLRHPNSVVINGLNLCSDNAPLQNIIELWHKHNEAVGVDRNRALDELRRDMVAYPGADESLDGSADIAKLNDVLKGWVTEQANGVKTVLEATFEDEQLRRSVMLGLWQVAVSGLTAQSTGNNWFIPVHKNAADAEANFIVTAVQSDLGEASASIEITYVYNGVKCLIITGGEADDQLEAVVQLIGENSDMSIKGIFEATPGRLRVRESSYSLSFVPDLDA